MFKKQTVAIHHIEHFWMPRKPGLAISQLVTQLIFYLKTTSSALCPLGLRPLVLQALQIGLIMEKVYFVIRFWRFMDGGCVVL